jgi:hypothetical protein
MHFGVASTPFAVPVTRTGGRERYATIRRWFNSTKQAMSAGEKDIEKIIANKTVDERAQWVG